MAKAFDRFLLLVQKPSVNEIFFRYQGFEYQICFAGRYLIVEDSTTGDAGKEAAFLARRKKKKPNP